MTNTDNTGDKSGSTPRRKTLSVPRSVEQGTVRQNFPHGRSKAVVVETKKRRIVKPGTEQRATEQRPAEQRAPEPRPAEPRAPEKPKAAAPSARQQPSRSDGGKGGRQLGKSQSSKRGSVVLQTLTSGEQDARLTALNEARIREAEEKRRAAEEAARRAEEEARLKAEREVAEKEAAEKAALEAEKRAAEEKEKAARDAAEKAADDKKEKTQAQQSKEPAARADQKGANQPGSAADAKPGDNRRAGPAAKPAPAATGEEDDARGVKRPKVPAAKPTPRTQERRRGRITVTNALNEDEERGRSLASMRRRREKEKRALQNQGPREKISREVTIPETITVQELANRMAERSVDVIKHLMKQGTMAKITDVLDADTAQLIAEELGHTVKRVSDADVEEGLFTEDDHDEHMVSRPPVVTVMGHVDHGKTSVLDALRNANVVSGEAGGITQHIGAYQVEHDGYKATFIDTPGHAAFTAMRARGAKSTDIVILVVAADDSVMPQTIEAINHARAAQVPIIVAINKIDKPDADPTRVKTDLLQHEVVVESMSGETLEVEISALKNINLDKLLEAIHLQSELLELKANPDRAADGTVIEAKLDRGRGPVATVLVQRGTIRQGDILVVGREWGRVRALIDDKGNQIKEAGPSTPVEVLGLQGAPDAGDQFAVVENEARAREIAEYRQSLRRDLSQAAGVRGSLEQMMSQLKTEGAQEIPVVIKGDVQGSVEAIAGALDKLGTDEVRARVIHSAVGGITESDVTLASASRAPILGFNVRANKQARDAAEREGIEIRYYNVIYDLVDDVKAVMSGKLAPEMRETFLGNAEILEVFNISKVGKVAGCRITEGTVERGAKVRLIRDNVVVHEGTLSTLKRFKDEVKDVVAGQECGMAFENYQDMRQGDVIECYRVEEIARSL